jgi:hypothetical protein
MLICKLPANIEIFWIVSIVALLILSLATIFAVYVRSAYQLMVYVPSLLFACYLLVLSNYILTFIHSSIYHYLLCNFIIIFSIVMLITVIKKNKNDI